MTSDQEQDAAERREILRLLPIWMVSIDDDGNRLTWKKFVLRLHAWRDVAKNLKASFAGLAEGIETLAIYLEHGLLFTPWPMSWLCHPHGECDENPHVWYPVKRWTIPPSNDPPPDERVEAPTGSLYVSGAALWMKDDNGWHLVEEMKPHDDHQCTCGMYKSDIWAFDDGSSIQFKISTFLNGLIQRDVQ